MIAEALRFMWRACAAFHAVRASWHENVMLSMAGTSNGIESSIRRVEAKERAAYARWTAAKLRRRAENVQ